MTGGAVWPFTFLILEGKCFGGVCSLNFFLYIYVFVLYIYQLLIYLTILCFFSQRDC